MSHTICEKLKLLGRVRRLRGQVEALERALDAERGCAEVLYQIVAVHGAINGLMAEVSEEHVRTHIADPAISSDAERTQRADELIDVLRTYLKREPSMHTENLSNWIHDHIFDTGNDAAERSTRVVMWITAAMMMVEIAAGWWFNSMALLADGWHMSSHAIAIGLSAMAYATARHYAKDPRFAFGTWKIEILGGFASAIFLLGVVVMMLVGSVERIVSPQPIQYQQAIVIAILGLVVNVVCALILGKAHHHDDGHSHRHGHDHGHDHDHHHDLNLKSAYLHVIADAATSVLAIVALFGGWIYGWSWLDPLMGIVGAVLVAVWAKGLIADTGKVLLDREMDHPVVDEIREVVETGADAGDTRITDLHVWRVGKKVYSCAMTVVTHDETLTPGVVRERLSVHEEIVHSTIEIHHCPDDAAGSAVAAA